MDRFDKITISGLVLCLLLAVGMLAEKEIVLRAGAHAQAAAAKEKEAYAIELELNKQIYQDVTAAMKERRFDDAASKLEEVKKKYPGRSFSHVVQARLNLQKGSMSAAAADYRRAVEMEPDYIDKKAPLFVGKEIKALVKEGLVKFSREKKLRPTDKTVKQALSNVYYLQRRLLGGCE